MEAGRPCTQLRRVLKMYRAEATRYDGLAVRWEANVLVAAIKEWVRPARSVTPRAPHLQRWCCG
jgi:plasmid replication initiation protein